MWELDCEEGWAPKNWCFWTVVLEKTLESPLDCKEISPGISLEGMMLKLKLQYFGHFMRRVDSLEKTLMLGGIGGRRGWPRMRWLDGITDWMNVSLSELLELVMEGGLSCWDSWGRKESDTTERLNWTEPLEHVNINFWGKQVSVEMFVSRILKLLWIIWVFPKCNHKCPHKTAEGDFTHIHAHAYTHRQHEDRGSDCSSVVTSQGMSVATRRRGGFFPGVLEGSTVLQISSFQISGLLNCEEMNFCCFNLHSLW